MKIPYRWMYRYSFIDIRPNTYQRPVELPVQLPEQEPLQEPEHVVRQVPVQEPIQLVRQSPLHVWSHPIPKPQSLIVG